jgi:hypothetical protein
MRHTLYVGQTEDIGMTKKSIEPDIQRGIRSPLDVLAS